MLVCKLESGNFKPCTGLNEEIVESVKNYRAFDLSSYEVCPYCHINLRNLIPLKLDNLTNYKHLKDLHRDIIKMLNSREFSSSDKIAEIAEYYFDAFQLILNIVLMDKMYLYPKLIIDMLEDIENDWNEMKKVYKSRFNEINK